MNTAILVVAGTFGAGPEPCDCLEPERSGILTRIGARWNGLGNDSCSPCGRAIFTGFTTACFQPVDPCGRPGLIDRLKARFQRTETCLSTGFRPCAGPAMVAPVPVFPSTTVVMPGPQLCALPVAPGVQIGPRSLHDLPRAMPSDNLRQVP